MKSSKIKLKIYHEEQRTTFEIIALLFKIPYTMGKIVGELYRSEDAIKSVKRKLFEKLGVSSITEAAYCAISRRLI